MPVTQDEFRAALSRFPSGVTVVTTKDGNGELHGMTVSAFCSVSLDPQLVLVCIEKTAASHAALIESGVFVVNILSEDQRDLSDHFASQLTDKFTGMEFAIGNNGLAILNDVAAILVCHVEREYDGGDHTIFLGAVEAVKVNDVRSLAYLHGDYRAIPH